MSITFHVTATGSSQGAFAGEDPADGSPNSIAGTTFSYQTAAPAPALNRPGNGKPQPGAVSFTKAWGAASPQFLQALATGEILPTVIFEFARKGLSGVREIFHTITLTDVRVSAVHKRFTVTDDRDLEDVNLVFRTIKIVHTSGGRPPGNPAVP